jgi:hypothetical protein
MDTNFYFDFAMHTALLRIFPFFEIFHTYDVFRISLGWFMCEFSFVWTWDKSLGKEKQEAFCE